MQRRFDLLPLCTAFLVFTLPYGVTRTALRLEYSDFGVRLWIGLSLIVVGIVGVECVFRSVAVVIVEVQKNNPENPKAHRELTRLFQGIQLLIVCFLQFLSVGMFFFMLDGHVHFRGACWLYLVYAVGAILLLAARWLGWTTRGSRYLRWGWVPILALGMPLLLPTMKAAGLTPFGSLI
jgi:hypothetical protein